MRARLDQLGYGQHLGQESLALVDKLSSDLLHATEGLKSAKVHLPALASTPANLFVNHRCVFLQHELATRQHRELTASTMSEPSRLIKVVAAAAMAHCIMLTIFLCLAACH